MKYLRKTSEKVKMRMCIKKKALNRVSARCRVVNLLYLLGLFLNASSL